MLSRALPDPERRTDTGDDDVLPALEELREQLHDALDHLDDAVERGRAPGPPERSDDERDDRGPEPR